MCYARIALDIHTYMCSVSVCVLACMRAYVRVCVINCFRHCNTMIYIFAECVQCLRTEGRITSPCEIDPEKNQFCYIACEKYTALCSLECFHDGAIPCKNLTTAEQFRLCCTTQYCNNITEVQFLSSSSTATTITTPTPSKSEKVCHRCKFIILDHN